jgi:hypothetical protein
MNATASAAPDTRPYVLEPLRPALIGVTVVHLLLAIIVLWLASGSSTPTQAPPDSSSKTQPPALLWFRPADFQSPLPLTTATPTPATTPPPATRNASRYITLSRVTSTSTSNLALSPNPIQPTPPTASPTDSATISELDQIDEALYEAFMQVWTPPDLEQTAPSKRTTRLDISLNTDLALVQADLVAPSGSTELDLSVLLAAEKVAERLRNRLTSPDTLKIPNSLPSSFQNSRYVCRIQFQIE